MAFNQRNYQWQAKKEKKLRESLERKWHQETAGCTFKPHTNMKRKKSVSRNKKKKTLVTEFGSVLGTDAAQFESKEKSSQWMTIPSSGPNNLELTTYSGFNFNRTQQLSYEPRSKSPIEATRISVGQQEMEKENDYCFGYAN